MPERELNLLPTVPLIAAGLVLLVAAAFKLGRERGALFAVAGAAWLVFVSVMVPIAFQIVLPKLVDEMVARPTDGIDLPERIARFYRTAELLTNTAWAIGFLLLAVGIFVRPGDGAGPGDGIGGGGPPPLPPA